MREIVLDTETTGLDPFSGDRIVEIGGVELLNQVQTGRTYHQYVNPKRDMPAEAFAVHGLSAEFLSDKPVFEQICQAFLDFVGDAKLVIHNAAFDMKFLNAELGWANRPPLPMSRSVDTLDIARRRFPGAQNTLDALCRRFGIDNSNRTKHGALLDSELLADVYLELNGGRQSNLSLAVAKTDKSSNISKVSDWIPTARHSPLPSRLTAEELAAHSEVVKSLGQNAIWKDYL